MRHGLYHLAFLSVLWMSCCDVLVQCHGQEEAAPEALPAGAEKLLNLPLEQLGAALDQFKPVASAVHERAIRAVDEAYQQIETRPDYAVGRVMSPLTRISLKGVRSALYRGEGLVLAVPVGGRTERDHFVVINGKLESEVVPRDSTALLLQANQVTLSPFLLYSGRSVYELTAEPTGLRLVHSDESPGNPRPRDLFECGQGWAMAENFTHQGDDDAKPTTRRRLRFFSGGFQEQGSVLLDTFGASTFSHSVVLEESEGAVAVCGDRAVHISAHGDVGKPVVFSATPRDAAVRPRLLQGCRVALSRGKWTPVSRSWSKSATALCWDGAALTAVSFRVPNSLHPRGLVTPTVCSAVVDDMLVTRGNQSEILFGFQLPALGDRGCPPGKHTPLHDTPPVWARSFPSIGGMIAAFHSLDARGGDAIQVGFGNIYFIDAESGLVRFRFSTADEPGTDLVPSPDELEALVKSKRAHGIVSYVVFGDYLLATTEKLYSDIVVWRIPRDGE